MRKNKLIIRLVNIILILVMFAGLCSCGSKTAGESEGTASAAQAGEVKSGEAAGNASGEAAGSASAEGAGTASGSEAAGATGASEETAGATEAAEGSSAAEGTAEGTSGSAAEGTALETGEATTDQRQPGSGMTAEELIEKINGPDEIGVFEDEEYVKKKNVETYLVLGIDNGGEYTTSDSYRNGGQSDLMLLIVLDKDAKTFTPVHINRDTMAVMDVLDIFGQPISKTTTQLTLAFSFGDGSDTSAQNACRAVSNLFGGIDINGYVALNYSGVPGINDAVGGVTVTLEDDMTSLDPALVNGATVTLTGSQAVAFCRARMNIGDGENVSRMRRQAAYMSAFLKQCKSAAQGRSAVINDIYNAAGPYMMSNLSSGDLTNIGSMILSYSNQGMKSPSGSVSIVTYANGKNYAEFTADSGNIAEIVKELYYTPSN